jgi:transposase
MILGEIGRRILANPSWRQLVFEKTLEAWNAQEATIPSELTAARRRLAEVEQRIANLIDCIEGGQSGPELDNRLAQRRAEKRDAGERVNRLEGAEQARPPEPSETWVDEQLRNLGEVLAQGTPAAAHALRDLVGGEVVVTEVRQPRRARHYLQGRFTITSRAIVERLVRPAEGPGERVTPACDDFFEEFTIDFREPPQIEALSERAKELYDQGLMNAQIAKRLGCSRSRLTALLKFWFESRGLEMPDGRVRRASLKRKHVAPPLYQRIADEVMVLYRQQMLLQEIAARLGVDRNTITAAIRWWHESRGQEIPDGRTRRKDLDHKTSQYSRGPEATRRAERPVEEPEKNGDSQ